MRTASVLSVVLLLVCSPIASAQTGTTATIATSAPVTLLPDANRTALATLKEGTAVQILGDEEDGWYRISFKDSSLGERVGYVRRQHVRLRQAPATLAAPPSSDPTPRREAPIRPVAPVTESPRGPETAGIMPERQPHAPVSLKKGTEVTLKVPLNAMAIEGQSMMGALILAADVEHSPGSPAGLAINNQTAWNTAGFPPLRTFKLEKMNRKQGFVEIELRSSTLMFVKLRFRSAVTDVAAAYSALVIGGASTSPDAVAFRRVAYLALANTMFAAPEFSQIASGPRLAYVEWAHLAGASSVAATKYKNDSYAELDLGRDTSVYNDLKFNQSTLVAHVLNEQLLKILKGFAPVGKDLPGVHGVKLMFRIPHYSFLDKTAVPDTYDLVIYAPTEQVQKYADADTTNQQFIDACVVLVDDNRVQVSLAGGGL